jgi:cytochrome oxidase assembly protein ShyY1
MLMPLKIAGTDMHIMVARGWFPRNGADRMRIPAIPAPTGPVTVEGAVRRNAGQVLQLGEAPEPVPGAILQNLDIGRLAKASGLKFVPYVLEQTNDSSDGLVRDWPRPSTGIDKHYGYAFQWFALAATAVIFFLVTGFRRGTTS